MALSTPVIASAHGGHLEIVIDGENGLLAPLEDTDAYVTRVQKVLHDSSFRRQMIRNALYHVENRYSAAKHAESILAIYRRMRQR